MKILIILSLLLPTLSFADNQVMEGQMILSGTAGDYIIGNSSTIYDSSTGKFNVQLNQENQSLRISYEDNLAPGEVFANNDFDIEFQARKGTQLQVGKYAHAKRFPFNTSTEAKYEDNYVAYEEVVTSNHGFALGGNGRACNKLTAQFEIRSLEIDSTTGKLTKFAATFKQHCESGETYASGGVILNSEKGIQLQLN